MEDFRSGKYREVTGTCGLDIAGEREEREEVEEEREENTGESPFFWQTDVAPQYNGCQILT